MSDRNPILRCLHHWPTRLLCLFLTSLQAAILNWYLMDYLNYIWAVMFAADIVVVGLFIASFIMATNVIHQEKKIKQPEYSDSRNQPLTYIAWLVYALVLDVKVCVLFATVSTHLDEDYFFGPNTCKTAMAIAGLVFITFLHTQHDVRDGSRKALILTLTATVLVDVLDSVEYLENLFEKEVRDTFPPYLDDAMIGVFCINFLLPTIPLLTLSLTRFGLKPLPERLQLLHKISLAYLVNLPLLTTRIITWHGLSQGISIFTLKNIVVMGVITFEVLEKWYTEEEKQQNIERQEVTVHENESKTMFSCSVF